MNARFTSVPHQPVQGQRHEVFRRAVPAEEPHGILPDAFLDGPHRARGEGDRRLPGEIAVEVLPLPRRLVHVMARVRLVCGHVPEGGPRPTQVDVQLDGALVIPRVLADAGDRSSVRGDEPDPLRLWEFEEPSGIAPGESQVSLHRRQNGVRGHAMFPFPGLDRRPESVVPAHVQDPSDLAAQGVQLRFGGRPRWEIVEVAHLSRQPTGMTPEVWRAPGVLVGSVRWSNGRAPRANDPPERVSYSFWRSLCRGNVGLNGFGTQRLERETTPEENK